MTLQDPDLASALDAALAARVVPVVVTDDVAAADPLADALVAGGLPCAEVTLRSPGALDVLARMARRDGIRVGAGTVTTAEQAERCVAAGASFLVSPGLSAAVVRAGLAAGVPVIPGVATPTEVMAALDLGLTTVKLFPASALGGLTILTALAGPFPGVRFVPTGGIDASVAGQYLAHPAVAAVGGSWMVAPSLLSAGDFDEVRRRTADAVALASYSR